MAAEEQVEVVGAFFQSLKRNNSQIKLDRATAISEDAEMSYGRMVEDLKMELKRLLRERANMLDLSPTNTQSLMLANDFDARKFSERDLEIGVKIRNLEIKIEVAEARYNELFT